MRARSASGEPDYRYDTHVGFHPFLDYANEHVVPEDAQSYYLFTAPSGMPLRVEDRMRRVVWAPDDVHAYGQLEFARPPKIALRLRFAGHFEDEHTGLFYNRFRDYDPRLGRYLQPDPIGIAGGENLYAYPANPLVEVDLRGLTGCNAPESGGAQPGHATPKQEQAPEVDGALPSASSGALKNRSGKPEEAARLGRLMPHDAPGPRPWRPDSQLLLMTGKPTTKSVRQVLRQRGRARWEGGERVAQEMYGSPGQQHFPVPVGGNVSTPGGRYVDAPVPLPSGGVLAVEVKTYQRWRTVRGSPEQGRVPLNDHIREQINKDVALRNSQPGYDPRWIFLDAPPNEDLAGYLEQNNVTYVVHH